MGRPCVMFTLTKELPGSQMKGDTMTAFSEIENVKLLLRNLPASLNATDEQALALMEAQVRATLAIAEVLSSIALTYEKSEAFKSNNWEPTPEHPNIYS